MSVSGSFLLDTNAAIAFLNGAPTVSDSLIGALLLSWRPPAVGLVAQEIDSVPNCLMVRAFEL